MVLTSSARVRRPEAQWPPSPPPPNEPLVPLLQRGRRFDVLDAIVNLSIKPVSACQPSRRTGAEQNHHNIGEGNQSAVKCRVVIKAVGSTRQQRNLSTSIICALSSHHAQSDGLRVGRLSATIASRAEELWSRLPVGMRQLGFVRDIIYSCKRDEHS